MRILTSCVSYQMLQLSDFGLARKADIFVPHEGGKFPVKWTAPEALKESVSSHIVIRCGGTNGMYGGTNNDIAVWRQY